MPMEAIQAVVPMEAIKAVAGRVIYKTSWAALLPQQLYPKIRPKDAYGGERYLHFQG